MPAKLVSIEAGGAAAESEDERIGRRAALLKAAVGALSSTLSVADLRLLAQCMEAVVVGECEPLLRKGEYVSALTVIERGCASASLSFEDEEAGKPKKVFGVGSCIGEAEFFGSRASGEVRPSVTVTVVHSL